MTRLVNAKELWAKAVCSRFGFATSAQNQVILGFVLVSGGAWATEPGGVSSWWSIDGGWFWQLLGQSLPQSLITLAYRKAANDKTAVSAALAAMFTVQGCGACGAAPEPLGLTTVVNSAVIAIMMAIVFLVLNRRRRLLTSTAGSTVA